MSNNDNSIVGYRQVGFRVPAGVLFWMQRAADDVGISLGEWLRCTFAVAHEPNGQRCISVHRPSADDIAIIGTRGCCGTLAGLRDGVATIDTEAEAQGPNAARKRPLWARWEDCERDGEGRFTGRLSPTRPRRKPGRSKRVKIARAREAIALVGNGDADARS